MKRQRRERYRGTKAPGAHKGPIVPVAWTVPCPICGCPRYRAACRLGVCRELPYRGPTATQQAGRVQAVSGRPPGPRLPCREPGCTYTTRRADGLCRRHYIYLRNNGLHDGPQCTERGCPRTAAALGWCNKHYMRHYRSTA